MTATPFVKKIGKFLLWLLGIPTAVTATGGLAITLHLFANNKIGILGINNNQSGRDTMHGIGNTINNNPVNSNSVNNNTINNNIFNNNTINNAGDIINQNSFELNFNQNNNSITVNIDNFIQEENKISNRSEGSTRLDLQTVTQFLYGENPSESSVLLTPPQNNTYWSFSPTTNIYDRFDGLGLNLLPMERETIYGNLLNSSASHHPTTAPLTQQPSNTPTSSGESLRDSISDFFISLVSKDEKQVNRNNSSCPW
jgi:hypothetical protein